MLYCINQYIKTRINFEPLKWFLSCYFNDIIGSITFMSYCGIVLEIFHRKMLKLHQIILLMFCCGLFWEYITPLFRSNTISDPFDIVAYILGGTIYWGITNLII